MRTRFLSYLEVEKYRLWAELSYHYVLISAQFGLCTVVDLNEHLLKAKIRKFKCPKCPFKTHKRRKCKISCNKKITKPRRNTNQSSKKIMSLIMIHTEKLYIVKAFVKNFFACTFSFFDCLCAKYRTAFPLPHTPEGEAVFRSSFLQLFIF